MNERFSNLTLKYTNSIFKFYYLYLLQKIVKIKSLHQNILLLMRTFYICNKFYFSSKSINL